MLVVPLVILASMGVMIGQQRQDRLIGELRVAVAEQPIAPGRAAVRYIITIHGPKTLQWRSPLLDDAFAAWRVQEQTSSLQQGELATLEWRLQLEQTKPGVLPLPGVRILARATENEDWHEFHWPTPLAERPEPVSILAVSAPPLPAWVVPALVILSLTVLSVGGWLAVRWCRHWKQVRQNSPSPLELAELQLTQSSCLAQMVDLLRTLFERQGIAEANYCTSQELIEKLAHLKFPEQALQRLQRVLALGDLEKFSGQQPTPDQRNEARQLASALLDTLKSWSAGKSDWFDKAG